MLKEISYLCSVGSKACFTAHVSKAVAQCSKTELQLYTKNKLIILILYLIFGFIIFL